MALLAAVSDAWVRDVAIEDAVNGVAAGESPVSEPYVAAGILEIIASTGLDADGLEFLLGCGGRTANVLFRHRLAAGERKHGEQCDGGTFHETENRFFDFHI